VGSHRAHLGFFLVPHLVVAAAAAVVEVVVAEAAAAVVVVAVAAVEAEVEVDHAEVAAAAEGWRFVAEGGQAVEGEVASAVVT